jgi:hypothetical protein
MSPSVSIKVSVYSMDSSSPRDIAHVIAGRQRASMTAQELQQHVLHSTAGAALSNWRSALVLWRRPGQPFPRLQLVHGSSSLSELLAQQGQGQAAGAARDAALEFEAYARCECGARTGACVGAACLMPAIAATACLLRVGAAAGVANVRMLLVPERVSPARSTTAALSLDGTWVGGVRGPPSLWSRLVYAGHMFRATLHQLVSGAQAASELSLRQQHDALTQRLVKVGFMARWRGGCCRQRCTARAEATGASRARHARARTPPVRTPCPAGV